MKLSLPHWVLLGAVLGALGAVSLDGSLERWAGHGVASVCRYFVPAMFIWLGSEAWRQARGPQPFSSF
jgi:hypothetical protein